MENDLVEKILLSGNREDLLRLFRFDTTLEVELIIEKFNIWGRYFFPKFFKSEDSLFHHDIDVYNAKVYLGQIKSFTDIAFRGAAKTTRTKILIAFLIANDKSHFRKYQKILSKDGANSKQSVTDIYNLLIDPRVVKFYPEIFQKTEYKREETMSSFTTAQMVKLTAGTVGTDQRGQLQDEARPDVIWFDDFETRKSLKSAVETKSIWDNMEEARTGLSKDGGCIYTCNYLSERGNVHKLVQKADGIEDIVMITPILKDGKATWPARYGDQEAQRIVDKAEDGAGEYLCDPAISKDVLFDRKRIDKMEKLVPLKDIAGFRIYKKFDASHRYAGGHDVAGGVGLDSSTSVFIDFDVIPAQVVAAFDDNAVKPDTFGDEVTRQGEEFGKCLVAPEKNNHGHATIGRLKQIYPLEKIFKTQRDDDKVDKNGNKALAEYGWETNALTKPKAIFGFIKAVNDGLLELNDARLIAECRSYTRNDLMDTEVDPRLTTRHFDLLMAGAICWQMKDFAQVLKVPEREQEAQADELLYPDIGM